MKKIPMRMCVSCRTRKAKKELIRVVVDSEGTVSVDLTGKKAGRGAYICRSKACMEAAVKANRLERGIRGKAPESVFEELWREIKLAEQVETMEESLS